MFLLPDLVRKQAILLCWHAPKLLIAGEKLHLFYLFYQVEIR
jgi:hypothetical protein